LQGACFQYHLKYLFWNGAIPGHNLHQGDPTVFRLLKLGRDSIKHVLSDGNAVMINIMGGITSPPGIFAIFDGVGIMVKRIEVIPYNDPTLARISTANTQYSAYQRNLNDISIIRQSYLV